MNSTGSVATGPVYDGETLDGMLRERVRLTPDAVAYRHYNETHRNWRDYTWSQIGHQVARWQTALIAEGLKPGDRVAVMLRNCPEWVIFDQAALALGLVVVPLYTQDRADNISYILADAGCRLLLVEGRAQWDSLRVVMQSAGTVSRILCLVPGESSVDGLLRPVDAWLPAHGGQIVNVPKDPAALATIVYTSGTTGRPKGVMLSHRNIVSNVKSCLSVLAPRPDDLFLSFLPLSHMFERTCGYYLAVMTGAATAYARSVQQLGDDLQTVSPTLLISVPRIYERVYGTIRSKLESAPAWRRKLFELAVSTGYARFEWLQGRGAWRPQMLLWPVLDRLVARKVLTRLGGRIRAAISGGAALPPGVAKVFIGLGLPLLQGYGMTELSPVACANLPHDNRPESVGPAVPGVEVRVESDGLLLVRGHNVMMGYWNNPEATSAIMREGGWLNTGDTARVDDSGRIYITGRMKEIIVMSNGEKVPPLDMEAAILGDALFEQVILLGEGKPYLTAMLVLNEERWREIAAAQGIDPLRVTNRVAEKIVLARVAAQVKRFPGYAQVRRVSISLEPWTIDNGLMTPTLKLKRAKVMERFNAEIDAMYQGH
jgi:long-chain acyl-CoA synthetase